MWSLLSPTGLSLNFQMPPSCLPWYWNDSGSCLEAEECLLILQTSPNHREPVLTSTPSPGPTTYRFSAGRPTVNSKGPAESLKWAEAVRPKFSHEKGRWTSPACRHRSLSHHHFSQREESGFLWPRGKCGFPQLKHWQSEQFLAPTLAPFFWGMRLTLILQITSTIKLFKTLYPGKIVNNSMLVLR